VSLGHGIVCCKASWSNVNSRHAADESAVMSRGILQHAGKAWTGLQLHFISFNSSRPISTSTTACTSHLARYLESLKNRNEAEPERDKVQPRQHTRKPLVDQLIGRGAPRRRPGSSFPQGAPPGEFSSETARQFPLAHGHCIRVTLCVTHQASCIRTVVSGIHVQQPET
jgi:hypothetical protein